MIPGKQEEKKMRLIDERELIRRISELPDLRTMSTATIGKIIKECTTIDAVPVVHASQRETGFDEAYCNWGDCTACGTSNIYPSKYCNECGARMDGDPHDSGQ